MATIKTKIEVFYYNGNLAILRKIALNVKTKRCHFHHAGCVQSLQVLPKAKGTSQTVFALNREVSSPHLSPSTKRTVWLFSEDLARN